MLHCYFSRMNSLAALHTLRSARSIGVVRTDRLGDMVCTLPLVQSLASEFPAARIHLIARSYCEPLLRCTAVADAVHYVDQTPLETILRKENFDALFFPRPVFSEVLAAFRAEIGRAHV